MNNAQVIAVIRAIFAANKYTPEFYEKFLLPEPVAADPNLPDWELDSLERLLIKTYRPPFNPQVRGLVKKGAAATWTAN